MTRTSLLRTRWAAVGAAVAVTLGAVGLGGLNIASAEISEGDRPVFVPINPCRLIDTRADDPVGASETVTITAHGSNGECTGDSAIPTDAVALALNVTATNASAATFLTFWGEGANPGTSNLNPRPAAAPTPNSVNTPLSTSGTFNIYNDAGTVNVIADVNGYYAHHDHDDRYEPLEQTIHVTPSDFVPEGPLATTAWELRFGDLNHDETIEATCVRAPVEIPDGFDLTGATVIYAGAAGNEADFRIEGVVNVSGDRAFNTFGQPVASYEGPIEETPTFGGGGAGSQIIGERPLSLEAGATALDDDEYNYSVAVCIESFFTLFDVRVDIARST